MSYTLSLAPSPASIFITSFSSLRVTSVDLSLLIPSPIVFDVNLVVLSELAILYCKKPLVFDLDSVLLSQPAPLYHKSCTLWIVTVYYIGKKCTAYNMEFSTPRSALLLNSDLRDE